MIRKYAFLFVFLITLGCKEKECESNKAISEIPLKVSLERKEQALFRSKSIAEVEAFLENNRTLADYFLDAKEYPADSILAKRLFGLINDQSIDSLYQDVYRKFESMEAVKEDYKTAFQHLKYYYPQAPVPKVQTMITGLYKDIYFSDTLFVIGLDFFVGADAKYKPVDVPEYIFRRFSPDYIVPASMFFLSDFYNNVNYEDNTLLNEMITAGKTYYFTKQMLPCAPDSLIIGYTAENMQEINEHEEIIWANFVENQVIYETSHNLKNKFMGERPNVYEIGEKCPGRIGAWVGWEIVKAYMENNPSVTLQQLMEEKDAKKIFMLSKYRPKP